MKGSGTNHDQVEKAMESFAGMRRAEADPAIFNAILQKAGKGGARVISMAPKSAVWMAAAGIALLIAINVAALTGTATAPGNTIQNTASTPYSLNTNLDFYNQ